MYPWYITAFLCLLVKAYQGTILLFVGLVLFAVNNIGGNMPQYTQYLAYSYTTSLIR